MNQITYEETRSAEIELWLSQPIRTPYYFDTACYKNVYNEFMGKFINVPRVVCVVNGKETVVRDVSAELYVSDKGYIEIIPQQEIGYNSLNTLAQFVNNIASEYSVPVKLKYNNLLEHSFDMDDKMYKWLYYYVDRSPHIYFTREMALEVFTTFNGKVVEFAENRRGILYVEPKGFIRIGKEYK